MPRFQVTLPASELHNSLGQLVNAQRLNRAMTLGDTLKAQVQLTFRAGTSPWGIP